MNIYTYSDLLAPTYQSHTVEAESIIEADAMITATGHNVKKLTVTIGIQLVVLDLSNQLAPVLLYKSRVANKYYYKEMALFVSKIFSSMKDLELELAKEIKIWRFNSSIQMFTKHPTMHKFQQHIKY